jgi:hypothetical protein
MTCTLNTDGTLGAAKGEVKPRDPFYFQNQSAGAVNVGAACRVKAPGMDDPEMQPFFVSPEKLASGDTMQLMPSDSVQVWFQREALAGFMIDTGFPRGFSINFEGTTQKNIVYGADGRWQELVA